MAWDFLFQFDPFTTIRRNSWSVFFYSCHPAAFFSYLFENDVLNVISDNIEKKSGSFFRWLLSTLASFYFVDVNGDSVFVFAYLHVTQYVYYSNNTLLINVSLKLFESQLFAKWDENIVNLTLLYKRRINFSKSLNLDFVKNNISIGNYSWTIFRQQIGHLPSD